MKAIRKRSRVLAASTGLAILVSISILVSNVLAPVDHTVIFLVTSIAVSVLLAVLWNCELRKLAVARLIAENPICRIHTAVIRDSVGNAARRNGAESIEVFVSYFGILLDSKIIKFNQDGILLKAVEIGRGYIAFSYGNKKWTQCTRLLRPVVESEDYTEMVERFRFETGIVPTFTD